MSDAITKEQAERMIIEAARDWYQALEENAAKYDHRLLVAVEALIRAESRELVPTRNIHAKDQTGPREPDGSDFSYSKAITRTVFK